METIVQHERVSGGCTGQQLVSVVIINYNYGRYLRQCIESALAQEYEPMEVIVVDDGSTDESRDVIESYSQRIVASFKPNGGVISATNHGFQLSHGSVVIFVDADDYLLPGAVPAHAHALRDTAVVRSQAYMTVPHRNGLSDRIPRMRSAEGDLRDLVLERGPGAYVSCPNSGNAWSRVFLERVFPLPERFTGLSQDTMLMDTAPLFGKIAALDMVGAAYRLHGTNYTAQFAEMTLENMRKVVVRHQSRAAWLEEIATSLGYVAQVAGWKASNWRLLTLDDMIKRASGVRERLSIADHLKAVLGARCNPVKRAMLACAILCIRLAPLTLSLYIAGRIIKLRFM